MRWWVGVSGGVPQGYRFSLMLLVNLHWSGDDEQNFGLVGLMTKLPSGGDGLGPDAPTQYVSVPIVGASTASFFVETCLADRLEKR